jgi:ribosomal protein L11 methylase PrmA
MICSGIIKDREQDVFLALDQAGLIVEERMEMGEWVALRAAYAE